jgi:hypothetical protein
VPYSTSPQALTRYLQHNGFTHCNGIHPGFDAYRSDVEDRSTVTYRVGYLGADLTPELRRERITAELTRMQAVLAKRYTVALMDDRDGTLLWLRVEEDPDSDLTASQKVALATIQAGGVVYRYKPLTPALNRPQALTSREMTPVFSHGLRAVTVLSLERMGAVKLSPITPESGKVIPLDG